MSHLWVLHHMTAPVSPVWSRALVLSSWSFCACSPHVYVDLLWVLWFPPTSQKHVCGWIEGMQNSTQNSLIEPETPELWNRNTTMCHQDINHSWNFFNYYSFFLCLLFNRLKWVYVITVNTFSFLLVKAQIVASPLQFNQTAPKYSEMFIHFH